MLVIIPPLAGWGERLTGLLASDSPRTTGPIGRTGQPTSRSSLSSVSCPPGRLTSLPGRGTSW